MLERRDKDAERLLVNIMENDKMKRIANAIRINGEITKNEMKDGVAVRREKKRL